MGILGYQTRTPVDFQTVVRELPRVIYSSDLGQTSQMDIDDHVNQSRRYFMDAGLTNERVEEIWGRNPIMLLRHESIQTASFFYSR